MQNNEFLEQLNIYRSEIDEIDSEILRLLAKRFAVVQQVGELKAEHGLQGSYIRPAREALMLRKLLDDAVSHKVPQSLVAGLWRLIIGASTAHESPLNVVHLHDDMQGALRATQYFSDAVPQFAAHVDNFWNSAHVNEHSIFIVPNDVQHHLWRDKPDHLKIFACLPFFATTKNLPLLTSEGWGEGFPSPSGRGVRGEGFGNPTHLAVANIIPEPTGNDISLFYDGIKLIEIENFINQFQNAAYYGSYAKPYIISPCLHDESDAKQ